MSCKITPEMFVFVLLLSHTLYKQVDLPMSSLYIEVWFSFSSVINSVLCMQTKAKRFDS